MDITLNYNTLPGNDDRRGVEILPSLACCSVNSERVECSSQLFRVVEYVVGHGHELWRVTDQPSPDDLRYSLRDHIPGWENIHVQFNYV
jgi:hypothetical protein